MEKYVDSSCPADEKKTGTLNKHGKFWQTKGTFTWSKDKNMKLTCHQYNGGFNQQNQGFNPSHQGHTGGEAAVRSYLSTKGCKCHDTAYLNVTSTDSRYENSILTIYYVMQLIHWKIYTKSYVIYPNISIVLD